MVIASGSKKTSGVSVRTIILNLWVSTLLGVGQPFHGGHISDVHIMITTVAKLQLRSRNKSNFMVRSYHITWNFVRVELLVRKMESRCVRRQVKSPDVCNRCRLWSQVTGRAPPVLQNSDQLCSLV